jgi:hypothetical protein
MSKKNILLAALLASLAVPAFANAEVDAAADADAEGKAEREVHMTRFAGAPMGGFEFHYDGPMMRTGRTVKNAPYSAEAISESIQHLQDGNQIVRKNSTLHYRDSAGRTRMEVRDDKGAVRNITINDGEATWILNPEKKTAMKVGVPRDVARMASEHARAAAEKAREGAMKAREHAAGDAKVAADANGRVMVFRNVERVHGEEHRKVAEDVRIKVLSNLDQMKDLNVRVAPLVAGAMADSRYTRNSTTKDLGAKEVEGVKAEGKQRSYEIPAGQIGNKNPIVVSSETWYSPDLRMTVYSRHSDPRSGERTYRLANLKRDEPAAALFAVPSDYTVTDIRAKVEAKLKEKQAGNK